MSEKPYNTDVEVFLSIFKYVFIFVLINNLIWAVIVMYKDKKSYDSTDTQTVSQEMIDTTNSTQGITNG